NDLGSPAAVVGHVAQRDDVDAFVIHLPPAGPSSAARRLLGPAWRRPASASGKWKWHRYRRARRRRALHRRRALAVDANRVDEYLALPNQLLDCQYPGAAGRIVPVRNQQERFLAILSPLRQRNRLRDGVVHRRAAVRRDSANRARQQLPIGRPSLQKRWIVAETIDEDLVLLVEKLEHEAFQCALRFLTLLGGHAAARIDRKPQADRNRLRGEVRDLHRLIVLVDEKIFSP